MKLKPRFLFIFITITLLILFSINQIGVLSELDKDTVVKVVMKLQKYDIASSTLDKLQTRILESLKYGIEKEAIFKILEEENYEKVKKDINIINEAINNNISPTRINDTIFSEEIKLLNQVDKSDTREVSTIDQPHKIPDTLKFYEINISPKKNNKKDIINVNVTVRNTSNKKVKHKFVLYINGKIYSIQEASIPANKVTKINFEFIPFVSDKDIYINVGPLEKIITPESHLKSKELEKVYIEGNLKLEKNEIREYKDKRIIIEGDIILNDNSELLLKNCHVTLETEYTYDNIVIINDRAKLEAINSFFDEGNHKIDIRIENEKAQLILIDSVNEFPISVGGKVNVSSSIIDLIMFNTYKETKIKNSKVKSLMINLKGTKKQVKLKNLKKGNNVSTQVNLDKGTLDINDTYIGSWIINIKAFDDTSNKYTNYIIEDSEIGGLWLHFGQDSEVNLNNIKPGLFENWVLNEEADVKNTNFNLTLRNTTLGVTDLGTTLKIYSYNKMKAKNLNYVQIDTWSDGEFLIEDSYVYYNVLMRGNNDKVILRDTYVRSEIALIDGTRMMKDGGGDRHYLVLDNAVIEGPIIIESTYSNIKGTVDLKEEKIEYRWGKVDREFPIIVKDKNGHRVKGIKLFLYDQNNKLIKSKKTNDLGKAYFNISFNKENHDKSWYIKLKENNKIKKISLSNNTPIVFNIQ